MMHAALLVFVLCGSIEACEEGEMRARSCAAAEAFIRAGMRAGQVLHVLRCQEAGA